MYTEHALQQSPHAAAKFLSVTSACFVPFFIITPFLQSVVDYKNKGD